MNYERFVAIACVHGEFVDPEAFEVMLAFCDRFKPQRRFLLGDIYDFAAFRGGSKGTADEVRQIPGDLQRGNEIIECFAPTDVVIGNHDWRVFKAANHPNALISRAGQSCVDEFYATCKRVGVQRLVDEYKLRRSYIEWAGYKWCHGWMYGENALRDHAEHFGNCVIGHLHAPSIARGRRNGHATGICVGMLADEDKLEYADQRRATDKWALGFLWGEGSETDLQYNLSVCEPGKAKDWRLPL